MRCRSVEVDGGRKGEKTASDHIRYQSSCTTLRRVFAVDQEKPGKKSASAFKTTQHVRLRFICGHRRLLSVPAVDESAFRVRPTPSIALAHLKLFKITTTQIPNLALCTDEKGTIMTRKARVLPRPVTFRISACVWRTVARYR